MLIQMNNIFISNIFMNNIFNHLVFLLMKTLYIYFAQGNKLFRYL